jgi:hypothetical protein
MPGIGLEMEGAVQQAPQPGRQCMIGSGGSSGPQRRVTPGGLPRIVRDRDGRRPAA